MDQTVISVMKLSEGGIKMKITLNPVLNENNIYYSFGQDSVTVTYDDITETFDFSGTSDGKATSIIADDLSINPIEEAERKDGELYLTILYFHSTDSIEAIRFPDWLTPEELLPLLEADQAVPDEPIVNDEGEDI